MSLDFLSGIHVLGTGVLGWVVPFLILLTIVVFFHELGHFLVARWCGVKVLVFSIGFGPELLGFNDRHGTRWKIAAVPLGGYVKFFGDENAASVPDQAAIAGMTQEERRHSFIYQPVARRAALVVAGPLANLALAVAIFALVLMVFGRPIDAPRIDIVQPGSPAQATGFKPGDLVLAVNGHAIESFGELDQIIVSSAGERLAFDIERGGLRLTLDTVAPTDKKDFGIQRNIPPQVGVVQPGGAAAAAGFKPGDLVLAIDGRAIASFADMQSIVRANAGKALVFEVERDGERVTLRATPAEINKQGILGIQSPHPALRPVGAVRAFELGLRQTRSVIDRTFSYIGGVIVGREAANQLGGPIRIAQVAGQAAKEGMPYFLNLAAVISISIGLLNLFPVPLLDGGHLMFYGIEAVRGKPLSERAQEVGFRIGFAIVVMLMIFATYNDILHFLSGAS